MPHPAIDLSPARWIWLPSQRTLPNTFVLFRREVEIFEPLRKACGWITADSRYRLTANGRRVQWGPAPSDPRFPEADPVDMVDQLGPGRNVIGIEALYFGHPEGTWTFGKPGVLFRLDLEFVSGQTQTLVSDRSWMCTLDRGHPPGQYKRWFLRALQEHFDARRHPAGWDRPEFQPTEDWLAAMELAGRADKPSACTAYRDYLYDSYLPDPEVVALVKREIPLMREVETTDATLTESGRIVWQRDPDDWFEFRMPDSYRVIRQSVAIPNGSGQWTFPETPHPRSAVYALFMLPEQRAGWPFFTIDAPEGTVVELICQESHDPAGEPWLDTHYYSWTRFICRQGINTFEPFDFECVKWIQLHIRNASRPVLVRRVGFRRRIYPWTNTPHVRCDDPVLQPLFDAALNTLANSAQETIVDGMGRERQQYSGDVAHQVHALRYAFGETRQIQRFLKTYSLGLSPAGYFLDCWPAGDRLMRVMQRQCQVSHWGPILDHGVQFVFDCYHHYLYTGDLETLGEIYPRLVLFVNYLASLRRPDGLLPVENLGVPVVWIDFPPTYLAQRHKTCAFNLFVAGMLTQAAAALARALGDPRSGDKFTTLGREIHGAVVRAFWDPSRNLFVNNLPWLREEDGVRLCDRSLAQAVLFDQCPNGDVSEIRKILVSCPPELGLSYLANTGWRYWALGRLGRADVITHELRGRWAIMPSIRQNNTVQEFWTARPDSSDQWSHCALAPLYVLFMSIAGIEPTRPVFSHCRIRPQLHGFNRLDLTAHTVRGPITFSARPENAGHRLIVTIPTSMTGELLLDRALSGPDLSSTRDAGTGCFCHALTSGRPNDILLPSSG